MDPITITAAILSQFQTTALVGTAIGGIIGNRADTLLCNSAEKIYQRIKQQVDEPANHDVQRAVRKAYLKATTLALKKTKELTRYRNVTTTDVPLLQKYLRGELQKLEQEEVRFPVTDFDENYTFLIESKGGNSNELLPEMIQSLKDSLFKELTHNKILVGRSFKKHIQDGWREDGISYEWYELMCAFFTEELKTNTRLSTFIQTDYLGSINDSVTDLKLSVDAMLEMFESYHTNHLEIISRFDELASFLEEIRDDQKIIIELAKSSKENTDRILDKLTIEAISVSEQYQQLTGKLQEIEEEEKEVRLDIEELQQDLTIVQESRKERKEKRLTQKKQNLLQLSEQKNNTQKKLEVFIAEVEDLYAQLYDSEVKPTKKLDQARALFTEGKFKEIIALFEEEDADKVFEQKKNELKA